MTQVIAHQATEIDLKSLAFYPSLRLVAEKTGISEITLLKRQVGFKAHPSHCLCGHEWSAYDLIIDTVDRGPHDWAFFKQSLSGDTKSFFFRKTPLKCRCGVETPDVGVLYDYTGQPNPWNSDERLKRDIRKIGQLSRDIGIYRFRYAWSDQVYVGVLAQEVQKVRPDAVVEGEDGYLKVFYDRLDLEFRTLEQWEAVTESA